MVYTLSSGGRQVQIAAHSAAEHTPVAGGFRVQMNKYFRTQHALEQYAGGPAFCDQNSAYRSCTLQRELVS